MEHISVIASRKSATEPITLAKCLEAFTQEEELGEENKIYCVKCKSHQQVTKKLQIWRLPPILIFHLKRLQNVTSRWIKSHKIVDFPLINLDPTNYLAAVPSETLIRHKELFLNGSMPRKQGSYRARNIGTIDEASEVAKTLSKDMYVSEVEDCDNANESVFDQTKIEVEMLENEDRKQTQRTRQISTSLVRDPVKDVNLKDFDEHQGVTLWMCGIRCMQWSAIAAS